MSEPATPQTAQLPELRDRIAFELVRDYGDESAEQVAARVCIVVDAHVRECERQLAAVLTRERDKDAEIAAAERKFEEHTKYVGRFLTEMYQTMIDPLDEPGLKVSDMCELLLHQAREDREKLNRSPANFPADWNEDSSLETWFPLTAEELERLKAQLAALKVSHDALLQAGKEAYVVMTGEGGSNHPFDAERWSKAVTGLDAQLAAAEKLTGRKG